MEQVVAVLDTLCDTKETTRAQVIQLVERLALRLEHQEVQCQQLREENEELQRLHHEQEQRLGQQEERIAELQRRLHQEESPIKVRNLAYWYWVQWQVFVSMMTSLQNGS